MKKKTTKYIFVVGGVMSGVGKGITSSSIGAIMQARGFVTTAIKIDPYINVDAGTMNPTEHGEVFVLNDGDECDQDMGNYERFLGIDLSRLNYMTTGRVYQEVIRRERNLEYGGKNVQVVPDVPKEVISRIEKAAKVATADVVVVEVGGTVGEYENILFLEAARMMKLKYPDDVAFVMVSYVPIPSKVGEMKTKPTQHASRTLNSVGVQADVIIARSEVPLDKKRKDKIAIFCNIRPEHVISAPDVDSIYDVPVNFERDKIGEILSAILKLPNHRTTNLKNWKNLALKAKTVKKPLNIAVVGKYFDSGDFVLSDVYISVLEAIKLSSYHNGVKPVLTYINSKNIETGKMKVSELAKYDGVLVPGGFGTAGIEGIIKAIQFAREKKIPYFGLCYGMQLAVIEYARHVAGVAGATSREINPEAKDLVIDIMQDQKKLLETKNYGGTMRLGAYPAYLKKGTIARGAYKAEMISERHRHRYEVNNAYVERLEKAGLVFSGTSPSGDLMEIAELPKDKHPFFLGTQFHPEFKAKPFAPHPLFTEFVKAAKAKGAKK
ncbi:MAG: synthase [Patescibacteria group bacterium]|nr:synthase [Patescibacteria group bacterium]